LNCAPLRSKAFFEMKLMLPPSESAGVSGVGTLSTSVREVLLIETCSNSKMRLFEPEAELVRAHAVPGLTLVKLDANPRTETVRTSAAT
jgi:hypothetical protein